MESIGTTPESVAHTFLRFINRHDVDALLSLMSPGHRFVNSMGGAIEGTDKLREGWTSFLRMVPDYAVAIEETCPSGPVVVMLGIAQGTYTRDGKLHPEDRWQTPVAIRALIEDLKVAEWRVYADNEPIRKLMSARR